MPVIIIYDFSSISFYYKPVVKKGGKVQMEKLNSAPVPKMY